MSTSIFECSICYNLYNDQSHKPLSLPCGHVFCEECLLKCTTVSPTLGQDEPIQETMDVASYDESKTYQIVCPQDKKSHRCHPAQLPCCFAILTHLPSQFAQPQLPSNQDNSGSQSYRQQTSQAKINTNVHSYTHQQQQQNYGTRTGSNIRTTGGHHQFPKALSCLRHPNKKIKYMCDSDQAFLCSKCVIQHTGGGHLITEYCIDLERIQSDFQDVFKKFRLIFQESQSAKGHYENIDKKLQDLCNRQLSKLDLTYKSMMRMLEQKRKEFTVQIREFYQEKRQKLEPERIQASKFYEKVGKLNGEFEDLQKALEFTPYEEYFKILNKKSLEISDLQQTKSGLMKGASAFEKNLQIAVFVDQVKISDYGQVQILKAQEYKSKGGSREEKKGSPSLGKNKKESPPSDKGVGLERNKALALDEKVSKKLNNIINRIHDPVTTKNCNKDMVEFSKQISQEEKQIPNDLNVLSSTTSINASCLFNKNLGQSVNQKNHHPLSQETQQQHRHPNPLQFHQFNQQKSDVDLEHKSKDNLRLINEYEKHAKENNSRRVTMVPQLRTDLLGNSSNRYNNQHKTQLDYDENSNLAQSNLGTHNVTTPYQGLMGSMTHRGEQLYERQLENNFELFIMEKEKKYSNHQQSQFQDQTYSKYLNPNQKEKKQQQDSNKNQLMTSPNDPVQESLVNPFENGLFRQSRKSDSIIQEFEEKPKPQGKRDRYERFQGDMSSDDELLSNMLQDIQSSKSQERRKPKYDNYQMQQINSNHYPLQPLNQNVEGGLDANKLSKYTSNHQNRGHQRKQKKEHSKNHHKSKKQHHDRHEKSSQPSHKRNTSAQDESRKKDQRQETQENEKTQVQEKPNQDQNSVEAKQR